MFSGADAPWHWIILAVLVIALFGYKKLPEASRSLGRSLRIFKSEIKGFTEDETAHEAAKTQAAAAAVPAAAPVAPVAPAAPVAPVATTAVPSEVIVSQTPTVTPVGHAD